MNRIVIVGLLAFAPEAISADYVRDIKPVLQERCYACHGSLQQKGKLRVDSGALLKKGGSSGPAITPGQAAQSLLIQRVTDKSDESRMPPEGIPLTAEQVRLISEWIAAGAPVPADDAPEADPRDHWAFRSPVRPTVPASTWGRNPVDAFLAAEWQKKQITPAPFADKRALLRRLSLDLIGLPPTEAEVSAFLADSSPDAYEKVVRRLLDSPQYGERWGRHFMDIWRYSDWWGLGAEVRNSQKHIWQWRDWIIESLNADVGYDRMVQLMLAGDEIAPTSPKDLRATGYLVRPYFIFNRTSWLDDLIQHSSKGFLGLTLNCAKCHDHKYDPISATDYYRFRAFFEPYQVRMDMLPGETDYEKLGLPRAYDCNADAVTTKHERGDERMPVKGLNIVPSPPAVFGGSIDIKPVRLPAEAHAPHLRPYVEANYLQSAHARIAKARADLEAARKALASAEPVVEAKVEPMPKKSNEVGSVVFKDDFARSNTDVWEFGPGQWMYEGGRLLQKMPAGGQSKIRLKTKVPDDFDARFRFMITGGDPYRSVGLSFDASAEHDVMVYVSAVASGPKVQVAYKQGGNYVYPADSAKSMPIKLNSPMELRVQVRGTTVNVHLDGQLVVAYQLPIARKPGHIELITYTASAEFRGIDIATLPASVRLVEAGKPTPKNGKLTIPQANALVAQCEASLRAAEAQLPSIQARFAAERAKYAEPKPSNASDLAKAAAKAEKAALVADAEESLARAELEVVQAATAQKPALEKKRDAARTALESARKAMSNPGETYTVLRGALKTKESNVEPDSTRLKPFPETSTGRRTALANWITSKSNPLTARVMVNHVWARHFGRPLVSTVFDFGRKGSKPSHPELLDWLATEMMEKGWSLKQLHLLLVTSDAYRLADATTESGLKNDPENRLLWKRLPARMESQVVRDSLLQLAGKLDPTMGGPSIPVGAESNRRSLYYVHSHNDHQRFLMQFDDAAVLECYRRTESIVPQQALTLSNSKFAISMADAITQRLEGRLAKSSDIEFIDAAFQYMLGYSPSPEERQACVEAIAEWKKTVPATKARSNLVGALVNHNDFVTVR